MKWYVKPGNLGPFDSRHEAIGAKAIHEREYSYYPLGASRVPKNEVPLRVECHE